MESLDLNLDGMEPEDLDELSPVLRKLADYAERKATAMRARLSGNIQTALRIERICERLYSGLPGWAKW